MRIVVTGGTGFVGSHGVRALLADGHDVVLLARERQRVEAALRPLAVPVERVEVVVGGVLDPGSVRLAVDGADALLHAANVYSLHAGDAEVMRRVNVVGTRTVLAAANEAGLDPIVHVSSCVTLLPSDRLTATSPVAAPTVPTVDRRRTLNASRGSCARPAHRSSSPTRGRSTGRTSHTSARARPSSATSCAAPRVAVPGGLGVVDVRDVAAAHARLFDVEAPPPALERYLMGGRWIAFRAWFRHLEAIVGRRLPHLRLPGGVAFALGRIGDLAQRRGVDPGFSSEPVWIVRHWPADADDAMLRLGVTARPVPDTLRDTVTWLYREGLVSRRQAGRAATSHAAPAA